VTPHDRARLIADVEEVGEPVTGRRREDVLRTRGVAQWEDKTGDVRSFLDKARAPDKTLAPIMPVCRWAMRT
jgi:hypothetical protein